MRGARIVFITGTGTGVGKTVLTAAWVEHLVRKGARVRAVKPLASGGRDDARALRLAQGDRWSLDEINPWAFRAALTPFIAARREGRRMLLSEVAAFCREAAVGQELLLVEGAGGLRSPLGEDFDAVEWIAALGARVVVVGWNRLGVLNEVRLTLGALSRRVADEARVVLMTPAAPDSARRSNLEFLRDELGPERLVTLPFLRARSPSLQARRLSAGLGALDRWALPENQPVPAEAS